MLVFTPFSSFFIRFHRFYALQCCFTLSPSQIPPDAVPGLVWTWEPEQKRELAKQTRIRKQKKLICHCMLCMEEPEDARSNPKVPHGYRVHWWGQLLNWHSRGCEKGRVQDWFNIFQYQSDSCSDPLCRHLNSAPGGHKFKAAGPLRKHIPQWALLR